MDYLRRHLLLALVGGFALTALTEPNVTQESAVGTLAACQLECASRYRPGRSGDLAHAYAAIPRHLLWDPTSPDADPIGSEEKNVLGRCEIIPKGVPIVPVHFKGTTYSFVLDTGCLYSCFDTSLPLGDPNGTAAVNGAGTVGSAKLFTAPPSAWLGSLNCTNDDCVLAIDLAKVRLALDHQIYGILGMSFLRRHMVHLNSDKRQLLILKTAPPDCGESFDLDYVEEMPVLKVKIPGGSDHRFLLDTGSTFTANLSRDLFERTLRSELLSSLGECECQTLFAASRLRKGRLKCLSVGGFALPDLTMTESEKNTLGYGFFFAFHRYLRFPS